MTPIVIGWPEGIYLALNLIGVGYIISKHGRPKTGVYHATDICVWLFLTLPLLYWGGFFS
jgi:hypothetical protein